MASVLIAEPSRKNGQLGKKNNASMRNKFSEKNTKHVLSHDSTPVMTPCYNSVFFIVGEPLNDSNSHLAILKYTPESVNNSIVCQLKYRQHASIVSCGVSSFLIIGGELGRKTTDSVEIFDTTINRCYSAAPLNVARQGCGSTSLGETVIICGGRNGRLKNLRSCEVYLKERNIWHVLPEMEDPRWGPAVVSLPDRRVFVIGGWNSASVEGCHLPEDSELQHPTIRNLWEKLAPMKEERRWPLASHVGGKIYVVGGNSEEVFTPPQDGLPNGQWTRLDNRQSKWFFSMVAASDRLFAFGSEDELGNAVEMLQPNSAGSGDHDSVNSNDFSSWDWIPLGRASSVKNICGVAVFNKTQL